MVADLPAPGRPVMTTFGLDVSPVASHASGWQQNDPPVRQSTPT